MSSLLGLDKCSTSDGGDCEIYDIVIFTAEHLSDVNIPTLVSSLLGIALLVFGFVENSLIEVISPCSVMYSNTYFSGRLSGSSVLGRWGDIHMRERDEVKQ